MTTRTILVAAALASLTTFAASTATAGGFDGSKNLLCATLEISECDFDTGCERKTYLQADFPAFVEVEFDGKRLVAVVAGDDGRASAIESVTSKDGKTILQGAEHGRAWSMVISQESGDMTATVADIGATFSVFGACKPD